MECKQVKKPCVVFCSLFSTTRYTRKNTKEKIAHDTHPCCAWKLFEWNKRVAGKASSASRSKKWMALNESMLWKIDDPLHKKAHRRCEFSCFKKRFKRHAV